MKYYIFFLVLLSLPLVFAESAVFVPEDSAYSLRFICTLDNNVCPFDTTCNVSIQAPNSTILIQEGEAVNVGYSKYEYNLSVNETGTKGEHLTTIECTNSASNGTSSFIYEVNPAGIRATEERTVAVSRTIYFLFGIGIILFIVFAFTNAQPPVRWTFFIFAIIFWLIAMNILFVGLQDEVVNPRLESLFDSLSAFSFYFLWFAGGLLIIMWIFTFFNTWFLKKNLANARRFGGG